MRRVLLLALGLAAASCAGDVSDGGISPDAGNGTGDAGPQCVVAFDPFDPVASPILPIRAYVSNVNAQGVLTYTWSVTFNGSSVSFTQEASDGSQIGFIAPIPGVYSVSVNITGPSACGNGAYADLTVADPAANADVFRLRTVPAPSLAPPQETYIQVKGGGDANRAIQLDAGIATTGIVKSSATNAGIPAYLKFMPRSMPTAFSETFSSATGAYTLRLLTFDHDVLVIPTDTNLAPKLVTWSAVPLTTQFLVGPGTLVTGTVLGPGNTGLQGAKVQLYAGGVPSTLGTTAANGSFSVRTDFPTTATGVTVKVTPPPSSGLPRLEATSSFSLASPLQIRYAAALATCDLDNVPVRRGAANQAGAKVTVVGTLSGVAGTIGGVNAANSVRVSATADGNGRLPAMLVPRGTLTAVTELTMTDHAASAVDTSTCGVASIDAPAMTAVTGTTRKDATTALDAIRIEAEPTGALALAGVPPVQITSEDTGAFSLPLAPGGRYNVRFVDPQARAAPLVASDVTSLGVPTNAILPKAITISGPVSVATNPNPVIGASVQILCATCTGLDATRPIAETATDTVSRYRIAVPDPGTM